MTTTAPTDALAICGWVVIGLPDLSAPPAPWSRRAGVSLRPARWQVVRPLHPASPVGALTEVIALGPDADVELIPGSQGQPEPPPPAARTQRVSVADGQALLVDIRCWLRLTAAATSAEIWEAR